MFDPVPCAGRENGRNSTGFHVAVGAEMVGTAKASGAGCLQELGWL